MTDNQNPDRNLGYQFYFLFRTHWWQDEDLKREPIFPVDSSLRTTGIPIDTDKRLFRRDILNTPLTNWKTSLKEQWKYVLEQYANAFYPDDLEKGMEKARSFCKDFLLGVALLITDENLTRHEVTIDWDDWNDWDDIQYHKPREVRFAYDQNALFRIWDKSEQMAEPATFHIFRPIIDQWRSFKTDNWALHLDDNKLPYLVSIQYLENMRERNYPVFIVYGLAHGDADTASKQEQVWAETLPHILFGDVGQGSLKKTAILNSIMARFLISEAVFETMDFEARSLRFHLQKYANHYSLSPSESPSESDEFFQNMPNHVLEKESRKMEDVMTRTDYKLARLSQAIKTLEINRDNLEWRLNNLYYEKAEWQIDWQRDDRYPPLLEHLQVGIGNLKNHVTYIQGKLADLKVTYTRWRSFITEHRYSLMEHLGHLGHIMIFLIALTKMSDVFTGGNNWLMTILYSSIVLVFGIYLIVLFIPYIVEQAKSYRWYKKQAARKNNE